MYHGVVCVFAPVLVSHFITCSLLPPYRVNGFIVSFYGLLVVQKRLILLALSMMSSLRSVKVE